MNGFENFQLQQFNLPHGIHINARVASGSPSAARPPLFLLHGFPQSHVCWRRVAQQLQQQYFLVLPDLRGYGDSAQPLGVDDHSNYSKREMAADVVAVADALGIADFFLAGHDRGGRVAHRLALDHPQRVRKLCVLDIAPTLAMHAATGPDFAQAYYHWFHLAQPYPLPELMIAGCLRQYLHAKLGGWGAGGLGHIAAEDLAEYERCFMRQGEHLYAKDGLNAAGQESREAGEPSLKQQQKQGEARLDVARRLPAVHAACEDYRASSWSGIDIQHDRQSRAAGQRLSCEVLAAWGERGVVARLFDVEGLWRAAAADGVAVRGELVPGVGHFIPEEAPEYTADMLQEFFR
ncbi:hypothetical protein OEZ86_013864 [Tetradesmus obliquus]|nr:hypothetical protein OEZ86_013864 [Tetradesmus obliquus]